MYQYTILSKRPHHQQVLKRDKHKGIFCAACKGGTLNPKPYTYTETHPDSTIENVPALVCNQCGEVYYTRDTMAKLETIVNNLKQSDEHLAVVGFADASSLALPKSPR